MKFVTILFLAVFSCACSLNFGSEPFPEQQEHQQVRRSLDRLITAYRDQDIFRFAEQVAENYTGDRGQLELQVQRDFSTLFDIDIRYTLNNVTSDGQGRVFVAITFNRIHTVKATGARVQQSGEASFVFIREGENYRLLSQRQPLFGVTH